MTPRERKALAEQITTNPIYADTLNGIERAAMERGVYAVDDEVRFAAMAEVRAIRSFRNTLETALQGDQPARNAPA